MGILRKAFVGLTMKNMVWVHGHRGSASTHPENTIPSFREAFEAGADFFELDTQLTEDDIPVVFHDSDLSARVCTDKQGNPVEETIPIRLMKFKDLSKYECGRVASPQFPRRKCLPGTPIPSLEQVLAWMRDRTFYFGINIEIKMPAEKGGTRH